MPHAVASHYTKHTGLQIGDSPVIHQPNWRARVNKHQPAAGTICTGLQLQRLWYLRQCKAPSLNAVLCPKRVLQPLQAALEWKIVLGQKMA
jgi:hypothetical protein